MNMLKKTLSLFICLVISLFFVTALQAKEEKKESNDTIDVCISGNYWLSGSINIEGNDVDKEGGIFLRGYIDSILFEKIAFGVYANFAPTVKLEDFDGSGKMYEFGGSFKYIAKVGEMPLKIGIGIGYRKISSDDFSDDVEGLGIDASAELQFITESGFKPFIEGGFLTQPAGGNEDVEVTWSPIFYLGAGIAF
jgi:hypothetical protein